MAHMRELRLREEEGAERGGDPAVTLHLTPSRTHAPGQGLCGRDDWKASDGGSPEEGKPVRPRQRSSPLPGRQPELAGEAPSADTQGWEEIARFISAESSRVYSHPGQWGAWCPFLEGVQ